MRLRIALVLALLVSLAGGARAGNWSFTAGPTGNPDVITCSDIKIGFWENHPGDVPNARRDQTIAVLAPASGPLRVIAPRYVNVGVQASSGATVSATVCEVAAASSESAANAVLDQVRIVNEGGELRLQGPRGDNWGAYVILSVPNGVRLDMSPENGALDGRGAQGTFTLETINGPISLARVRGKVEVRSTNGPIDFVGHQGDMDLQTQNGPVSVKLDDASWSGKGLDGHTQNGPVSVDVPDNFQ